MMELPPYPHMVHVYTHFWAEAYNIGDRVRAPQKKNNHNLSTVRTSQKQLITRLRAVRMTDDIQTGTHIYTHRHELMGITRRSSPHFRDYRCPTRSNTSYNGAYACSHVCCMCAKRDIFGCVAALLATMIWSSLRARNDRDHRPNTAVPICHIYSIAKRSQKRRRRLRGAPAY